MLRAPTWLAAALGTRQTPVKSSKKQKPPTKNPAGDNTSVEWRLTKKPRPGYCFKCGEDGHMAPSCIDEPNPELVEGKFKRK